jgi:hypothetical protein
MLAETQGVLRDLMTPEQQVSTSGQVGSFRFRRQIRQFSWQMIVT